jgi:hypothetical protein
MGSHLIQTCIVCTLGLSVAGEHREDKELESFHPRLGEEVALFLSV